MYCAQINSLTYSILTQNYRNTGRRNNENGTIIFQVPVVVKFNYRRKESILSIHYAGHNGDVRFRCGCMHASMWIGRHLLRGLCSACSYLSVTEHRFPFPGRKGNSYGLFTQHNLWFPMGFTWNKNVPTQVVLLRASVILNLEFQRESQWSYFRLRLRKGKLIIPGFFVLAMSCIRSHGHDHANTWSPAWF